MPTTKIYLELTEEIQQLLSDNQLSIGDILNKENIEADLTSGVIPEQVVEGGRSKEVVTIILASSAAVVAIGTAITMVLNSLNRKPHLVEVEELQELRDAQGNLSLDGKGDVQFKRIKKYELLEPKAENSNQSLTVEMNPNSGFVMKVSTATDQKDQPKS